MQVVLDSWSILNGFGAVHASNVYRCLKPQKNSLKTPMLVPEKGKAVSSACCYDKQQVCNRSLARRANSGKITISLGVVPLFDAFVQGESPHPAARN